MDINYLVKQNGTVQVIAENYKYSRTSHAAHKDGTLEYKCSVPKCGVVIKIKEDKVTNLETRRKHSHDPLSCCQVECMEKVETLKIKVFLNVNN
jgi:hypothetical protein